MEEQDLIPSISKQSPTPPRSLCPDGEFDVLAGRREGGGGLYDSFELNAVAKQLNTALQRTQKGSSLHSNSRWLGHLYRNKCKKLKQLDGVDERFIPRMWRRLRDGLFRRQ